MKAKLTDKHTLHLEMVRPYTWNVSPSFPKWDPGTWGSWLLDETDKLVPDSQFAVDFGDFHEAYKRDAYDKSVDLLHAIGSGHKVIEFENLRWE